MDDCSFLEVATDQHKGLRGFDRPCERILLIARDPGSPSENGNGTTLRCFFECDCTPQSSANKVIGSLGND